MNWKVDQIEFGEKIGLAESEAVEKYIGRLTSQNLPPILSPEHFSHVTNVKIESLFAMSNSSESFYRSFFIPKKSGGLRRIDAPLPSLSHVQRSLLDNILQFVPLHPSAKAYRVGQSTFDNARFHRSQKLVLRIDVKNFFGSIEEAEVYKIFHDLGYSKRISKLFSMLSCLNGSLPQGAPTSGAISNIFLRDFDEKVFALSKAKSIRYTRYADDLTFSGNEIDVAAHIAQVDKHLSALKLWINKAKTKLLPPHVRQEVTGLVVNKKVAVPNAYRRKLRQECYFISKFGVHGHAREIHERNPRSLLERVIGQLAYVMSIHRNEPYWKHQHAAMLEVRRVEFF